MTSSWDPTAGSVSKWITDPVALDAAVELTNAAMMTLPQQQLDAWSRIEGREIATIAALVALLSAALGRLPGRSRPALFEMRDKLHTALLEELFARPDEGPTS